MQFLNFGALNLCQNMVSYALFYERRIKNMTDSMAAYKVRDQLKKFVGIVFPHVDKCKKEFFAQMIYGISAAKSVLLSKVGRALQEDILLKKTEERLSRHLLSDGLEQTVHDAVLAQGISYVHDDTIISIDPSDLQKPYAHEDGMPLLAKVWDGSKGRVGDNLGYNLCFAVACPSMSHRIVPLYASLWSTKEEGFTSENDKVKDMIKAISSASEKRGIYVYDRGGDGDWLFNLFITEGLDFIVRLVGNRHVLHWNGRYNVEELARTCKMEYKDNVTFKSHGKEVDVPIEYGSLPVKLPEHPDKELRLVVVRWSRSEKPMMLLTTLNAARSRRRLRQVVRGYLSRWRIEETIRYIKQAYELEDVRLLKFDRLRAIVSIVSAVAYFSMAWLGIRDRIQVLAENIKRISKRMFEVPEFYYYAIADGISMLFVRHGRWNGLDGSNGGEDEEEAFQLKLAF